MLFFLLAPGIASFVLLLPSSKLAIVGTGREGLRLFFSSFAFDLAEFIAEGRALSNSSPIEELTGELS